MPPRPTPRAPARPRATVTRAFLFSDLRGYTDFVEQHGDSAAAELLRSYRDIVRKEIGRHEGAEIKTEGDSFYVVFEAPSAALECAVHVQRAANASERPMRIGMGVHAGETVPYDDQFVGSAVNIAARLASKAKAGEIVISDTFRGLVRTSVQFPMEDRGPLRLKGVTERVRAWTVEWRADGGPQPEKDEKPAAELPLLMPTAPAPAAATPGQLTCPVVVGRTAERAKFVEHMRLASSGRGQVVVLAGEAGVGKSAFVRDAIAAAGAEGFRVLYGATLESDAGLPYAPFVAAIRSGFRGIARDRLGRVLAHAAPDLAQLFPELGKAQRSEATSAVEQHRLSVAFLGLFATFAREAPVLVVVEDLHWADEASLGLLHYLARELRDQRVLLLATYRSDEMHRRHPMLRTLAAMQRERLIAEIALTRLDKEQVRTLIHETFVRTDPGVQVSDEFVEAIYARSEGNPFFTEELLKSLVEAGDVYFTEADGWGRKPIDQMRIPGSVREAVRERIDRLSEVARETLSAAAVIGLRFAFDLLRGVRGVGEAELEGHLRELIEQQLVIELGGDRDEYGFRHALTKEVVYDDLLVRERKRLHRGVADVMGRDDRAQPALFAHHLIAAGDGSAAVPHLLTAAERAARAYAPREAVVHYERAIEIGLGADELPQVVERMAEQVYLFDFARARKAAEEAAALYGERGDARGRSRTLRFASRAAWQVADQPAAERYAQEAIDVLDGVDAPAELGRALANMATLRMLSRDDEQAIAFAERAEPIGRSAGDDWTVANALVTKGTSLARRDLPAGLPLIRDGLRIALDKDLAETASRAYNNILVSGGGELPAAELDLVEREAVAHAERHGIEVPVLKNMQSFRAWVRGDWDRALAIAESVPAGSYWSRSVRGVLGQIAFGRAGPAAALEVIAEVSRFLLETREGQGFGVALIMRTAFHLLNDDRAAAADWFGRLLAVLREDARPILVIANGPVDVALLVDLQLDQPDPTFAERIRSERPSGASGEIADRASALAAAVRERDADAAARTLADQYAALAHTGFGAFPIMAILAARELVRRGGALTPEWRRPLAMARAYSEKARATWFLAELDRIEALIH